MARKTLAACVFLITAIGLTSCTRQPSVGESARIGRTAPSFELPDLSGHNVSLSQYKGKIVMLDFWATWCGPCRMTMPLLEKLQREYSNNLALLAINLEESDDTVRSYVEEQKISSTVLLDKKGDVGQAYGTESIPMQVLIDKTGIVRHIQVGYSPSMAAQLRAEINRLR